MNEREPAPRPTDPATTPPSRIPDETLLDEAERLAAVGDTEGAADLTLVAVRRMTEDPAQRVELGAFLASLDHETDEPC